MATLNDIQTKTVNQTTEEDLTNSDENMQLASVDDMEDYDDLDCEAGTTTSSSDERDAPSSAERMNLAKNETTAVFRLRLLVFLVLLLAAIAVSVIVYLTSKNAENHEYESQYEGASKLVLEAFLGIVEVKLQAVSSLGVAIIAHGVDHVREWPFVTLSSFQQRSLTAREQSGALYVHINPAVPNDRKSDWEAFIKGEDSYWIEEGLLYQSNVGSVLSEYYGDATEMMNRMDSWPIWTRDENGTIIEDEIGPYMPTWQTGPVLYGGAMVNENLLKVSPVNKGLNVALQTESVVVGEFIYAEPGGVHSDHGDTATIAALMSAAKNQTTEYEGDPLSLVHFPIFDSFEDSRSSVAVMTAWVHWRDYFNAILPQSLIGVDVVLEDTCSGSYTYRISGDTATPVGKGDLHQERFDAKKRSATFESLKNIGDGTKYGLPLNKQHCMMSVDVYPSDVFYDSFNTSAPIIMTVAVALIFIFTVLMFLLYDRIVERRQALVMRKAIQSNAIVASLFPANVRDRLMQQAASTKQTKGGKDGVFGVTQSRRLKGYLDGGSEDSTNKAPIADLFPNCTVMFCDIAGFTAWSSTRSPEEVFMLLQSVYQAFDKIAKKRKVFKVETIGDSYLAVCGLPDPQSNHAIIMCRFAWECLQMMHKVVRELEVTLGPDTADLSMRFGLHSGPVTAGVLQGDRARFQLFGDTVNTAARMESNGQRGKIQVSEATADILSQSDRGQWLTPRSDKIMAKGKGYLQTYWLNLATNSKSSSSTGSTGESASEPEAVGSGKSPSRNAPRNSRLVNWVSDILLDDIKKLVHTRKQSGTRERRALKPYFPPNGTTCMDEVKPVIDLEKLNLRRGAVSTTNEYKDVEIEPKVVECLREYVAVIAGHYRENPFHSFDHACHVTMSVKKLLKRIVAPELSKADAEKCKNNPNDLASHLHDSTYGITSDPMAVLAITFAALIHDVDHRGCSNMQLANEAPAMAEKYCNKSIAEQNSLDLAWKILMEERFDPLRRCMFASQTELMHFRQIIVNTVLATDIFDKQLNDLRKARWAKAFAGASETHILRGGVQDESHLTATRATIVIEHIIQASDVSHTMQHWHIYQKWNKALFLEMSKAYQEGRMGKDPSTFWYKGEIGFFDNYVIPLAKKLKECGVFGVSSDEYLNYAMQNRAEWAERGEAIVKAFAEEASARADAK